MEHIPLLLQERESLNASIVDAINQAADCWGIRCLRYEIKDIHVPPRVKESMQMQVGAKKGWGMGPQNAPVAWESGLPSL